ELIGCDLAWKRDGAEWVLLDKRRRICRVAPDSEHRGLYRVVLSRGRISDMANLSWAKDAALAVAIRELEWESRDTFPRHRERATEPAKCPVKGGPLPLGESLVSLSSQAERVDSSALTRILRHLRRPHRCNNLRTPAKTFYSWARGLALSRRD